MIDALAARILTLAADNLRPYETVEGWLPGVRYDRCMTDGLRDIEIGRARQTVLIRVTNWKTVDETRALVASLIPSATGTVAEYVDQLRKAAEECHSRAGAEQAKSAA